MTPAIPSFILVTNAAGAFPGAFESAFGQSARLLIVDNLTALPGLIAAEHPVLLLWDAVQPVAAIDQIGQILKADAALAELPVIFLLDPAVPGAETSVFTLGATDFLPRAASPDLIRARLRPYLALRTAADRLKQQTDLLQSLVHIDVLTKVPNRRRFDELITAACQRATRTGQVISVALFDVDYCHPYNEHYGNAMGDHVLQQIAAILLAGLRRPGDLVARYGGDEFIVVLPDTPPWGCTIFADRLRHAVEALAIPHAKSGVIPQVTVSVGTAGASGEEVPTPETLLRLADARLDQAKIAGRNRVVGHSI